MPPDQLLPLIGLYSERLGNGTMVPQPRIDVQHVTDAVVYMVNLPLDANVQFVTLMATTMPFVGRG